MAEQLAGQVNGRLYAAELLLREWERHGERPASRALEQAFSDSVVLQLAAAYRFYLREVAAAYHYRGHCDSAAALRGGLAREGRDSAEVAVLSNAEQSGELTGLAIALKLASGEMPAPAGAQVEVLAREGGDRPDVRQCRDWLRWLRELIDAQRDQLQEW